MTGGEDHHNRQARITGSATVPAGVYIMTVGPSSSTTLSLAPRERRVEPPGELVTALEEQPPEQRRLVDRANTVIDTLSAVTDKVERLTGLFRAVLEGRLPSAMLSAEEVDDGLGLVGRLYQSGRFREVIEVGRPLCRLFVLTLRWAGLVETLQFVLGAAKAIADPEAIAWAEHELGTLYEVAGDASRARSLLEDARDIRARIGDDEGLEATKRNLGLLGKRIAGLPFVAVLAGVGVLVLTGVGLGIAAGTGGGGPPPPISASVSTSHTGRGGGTTTSVAPPPAGLVGVAPSRLDFGTQQIHRAGQSQPVTITNAGHADLDVASVKVTGAAEGDFAVSDRCSGHTLRDRETCTVGVAFTPTGLGNRVATLTVAFTGGVSARQVALSGSGARTGSVGGSPVAKLTPTQLSFTGSALNQTSKPMAVMLANDGNAALSVGKITIAGAQSSDFNVASDACSGQSLAAKRTCTLEVTFTAAAIGPATATLSVPDNANPATQTVALMGVGVGTPQASLQPPSLGFGDSPWGVKTQAVAVMITNSGNAALVMTQDNTVGANSSDFAIASDTCAGHSFAPTASCAIAVTFEPTAVGPRTATLSVGDNAGQGQQIPLSGTGTGSPTAVVHPQRVGLSEAAGQKTVTLFNTGTAPLIVQSDSLTDPTDFAVSGDACSGHMVAPGTSCSLNLSLIAKSAGNYSATLRFTDNAASSETVSVYGTVSSVTSDG